MFPLDDVLLGPASFGRRKGTEGIIWHTTEATDASRASALGTARWQLTNPGSYNWIIYDGGLLLTVPPEQASGGVNPASTSWAPQRYPFLKQLLSLAAYSDPNGFCLNVAFSGRTATFRDQGIPPNMIDTAVRLTRWVESRAWAARTLVHSGHMHWQSNRSDPSQKVLDLIASRYRSEDVVADIDTFKLEKISIDAGANIRSAPRDDATLLFQTASASSAVSIGTKNGFHCYWINAQRIWGYTSTAANVTSAEPYQNIVEVVKEVPTGITQAQLDEARKAGQVDMKTRLTVKVQGEPIL